MNLNHLKELSNILLYTGNFNNLKILLKYIIWENIENCLETMGPTLLDWKLF